MKDKFKLIKIVHNRLGKKKINDILESLFLNFKKEDIYFKISKNEIDIFVRALNFRKFNDLTDKLLKSKKIKQDGKNLVKKVLGGIENIRSYGIKGNKRIYVDYNAERKVKSRKQKAEGRTFKKEINIFPKEINPVPSRYQNEILCADSLSALKKLPDNCIDLIFTSPPYNFGLDYSSNSDAHLWDNYFSQLFRIFDECIRILKFGGRFIVNIQPLFSDYVPSHHIISNYFLDKKMLWKGEIIWEKNNYNCKYTAWGSWKSPSSPYLKYTWEFLEIFAKGSLKKEGDKNKIDITSDEFKKWVVSKWSIAPERNMKKYKHPAMFPEELAYRVIKLFSYVDDIVLDPFNGVGTTTAVAKKLNRRFLGIDISNNYCNKAKRRLRNVE